MPHIRDDDHHRRPAEEPDAPMPGPAGAHGASPHEATPADDHDAVSLRRERILACPAQEAWAFLRDAAGLERWLADEVDLVVAPGEEGTLRDGDEELAVLVESVDEGRRLSLRWWNGVGEPSVVDLTLEPLGDEATRLVVTELPLPVVSAPATMPATWDVSGGGSTPAGPLAVAWSR